jgi:hypothetical protein
MPNSSIPRDREIDTAVGQSFFLQFDKDGDFDHDDHPGKYLNPPLKHGNVKKTDGPVQYTGKKAGTIKCNFTPANKRDAPSMHTILVGDRKN